MFEVYDPDETGKNGLIVDDIFRNYLFRRDMELVEIYKSTPMNVYVYRSEDFHDGRYIEIITAGRCDGREISDMDYLLSLTDTECLLKDESGKTLANFETNYED